MGRGRIASPLVFSFWEMVSANSQSPRGNVTTHTHAHDSAHVELAAGFSTAVKHSTFVYHLAY